MRDHARRTGNALAAAYAGYAAQVKWRYRMRLFISWSGERSKAVAHAMRNWLPLVLSYVDPWLSDADIGAGERWAQLVAEQLTDTNFGIVCITPENLNSPWILFESGALAKSLEAGKVIPLLLNLELSDVSGPLAQFQAKKLDRDGMLGVVRSLQSSAEAPVPEERVAKLFSALWPDLEKELAGIPADAPAQRSTRPQAEVLEDLVSIVRTLDTRMLPSQEVLAELSRSAGGVSSRARLSPGTLRDIVGSMTEGPYSPTVILIYSGFFRDEMPWISEVALNAYRALTDRRRDAAREARRLIKVLEMSRYFISDLSASPKLSNLVLSDFLEYLQYFAAPAVPAPQDEEPAN